MNQQILNLRNLICITISVLLLFSISCKEKGAKSIAPPLKTNLAVPAFDGNNAYANIEKQLSFGYRVPGTEAHKNAIKWMTQQLESYGAEVILQNFKASFFDEKDVPCTNIMAQINPDNPKRVLLAAHFDSRIVAEKDDERKDQPIPGADDGGSGVGILLEIAKMIQQHPIGIGVDILLFDAEDQGGNSSNVSWALGSQYWSRNIVPRGYSPQYGILLDMVGSKGATFGKEENSANFAPALQNKIWTLAENMGYSDFFQDFRSGAVLDDHYFVNQIAKIKMVDIIHQDPKDRSSFGFYHHTHDDNMDVISKRTLRVVGQVLTAVLYNESNGTF